MALANVGDILARRGLRVLMIDFDLEAPGLEQYFQVDQRKVRANLGLFDLILQYKAAMSAASIVNERDQEFRQLRERFITEIYPRREGSGQLDLMTAGQRGDDEQLAQYALNLRQFDWQDFFFNWGGELFFEWLRRSLDRQLYDIVLVDSRTGVTEMGGICAYQLADVIVVLCAANQQNLDGTHDIVRNFFSPRVRMLRRERDLGIVVVPARIEVHDQALLADYRKRFEALFGGFASDALAKAGIAFWDLLIPYEPQFAFQERVLSTGDPREQRSAMRPALEKLVQAIGALSPPDDPNRELLGSDLAETAAAAAPQFDLTSRSAGYDAFLSYSNADTAEIQAISETLRERNVSVWYDAKLSPGQRWDQTLIGALDQSRACVLFVGPHGEYPWRREWLRGEIEAGIGRGLKLVPVLLPGASLPATADMPVYLRNLAWCRFAHLDDQNAIEQLVDALTSGDPSRQTKTTVANVDPYRGLQAFEEPDAPFFFGREELINLILQSLFEHGLLIVVGASGVGKSSVVRAGLIPRLQRDGWGSSVMRPRDDPVRALIQNLARAYGIEFDTTEHRRIIAGFS